jgi:NADH:ubiquinone oxidoreductase subunit F (NADH-binding)
VAAISESSDIRSFYSWPDEGIRNVGCRGTACFVASHGSTSSSSDSSTTSPRVYCFGKCYAAPATLHESARPRIEICSRTSVILDRVAAGGAHTLDEYERRDGLAGLRRALSTGAEQVITEVEKSELRGRGGAAFPTGRKWRTAANQASPEKYVVANLDEGDPGAYIDRFLAEDDPFCLLEGMAIAAIAIGAHRGWIYARCEYPAAIARLQDAIEQARNSGLLGPAMLGSDFAFDVELTVGHGSYVCGEETALLSSIEGKRPVARVRPPYTAEHGLWNAPTIVNNVETLANVPWIMRHGATSFARLGIPGSRGTKCLSLNSLFRRPGLYEVDFGTPLDEIVTSVGGGLATGTLSGLWIGGPLAGVIPPTLLDSHLGFNELRAIGASVGHGGVIAFDEHTSIRDLVHHVFEFGAFESCGQCTPCRLGTSRIARLLANAPATASRPSQSEFDDIVDALKHASLCGLGTGLAEFAESITRYYGGELRKCFA